MSEESRADNEQATASSASQDRSDVLVRDSVTTALNLGWWMAEAFKFSSTKRLLYPDKDPRVPKSLANLSEVQPRDVLRMYIDGIEVSVTALGQAVPHCQNMPSAEPARAALKALDLKNSEAADRFLMGLDGLNIDILTWLLAADRRLGLAYRIGRSLFMTTRNQETHLHELYARFDHRVIEIRKWLEQLASALPPYSTEVVRHSLGMWTTEVRDAQDKHNSDAMRQMARRLPEQGDIWRSLLSGDLDGRIMLDSSDYAEIAEQLALDNRRLFGLLTRRILFTRPAKRTGTHIEPVPTPGKRRGVPLIVYISLAIAVILVVSVFAATGSPTVRVAAALVALAGGAISVWRAVFHPLNAALRTVNRPLYGAQLTAHIAGRISWPLENAKRATAQKLTGGPANGLHSGFRTVAQRDGKKVTFTA